MAGLVHDVDLVQDGIDIFALVGLNRFIDIPLCHLAVQEQGGKRVALAVKGGMQGAETQLRLCHHHIARLYFVAEQIRKTPHI